MFNLLRHCRKDEISFDNVAETGNIVASVDRALVYNDFSKIVLLSQCNLASLLCIGSVYLRQILNNHSQYTLQQQALYMHFTRTYFIFRRVYRVCFAYVNVTFFLNVAPIRQRVDALHRFVALTPSMKKIPAAKN